MAGRREERMATATEKKKLSYEDYARLGEGAPYQLIDGDLVKTPAPNPIHQNIVGALFIALKRAADNAKSGQVFIAPIDVQLTPHDVFQPDLIFIAKDRSAIIGEAKIEGPPDLAIEVLSPGTAYYDMRVKKAAYAKAGVREYWIVDPMASSIEVYVLESGAYRLDQERAENTRALSRLIPEFQVDLAELFAPRS